MSTTISMEHLLEASISWSQLLIRHAGVILHACCHLAHQCWTISLHLTSVHALSWNLAVHGIQLLYTPSATTSMQTRPLNNYCGRLFFIYMIHIIASSKGHPSSYVALRTSEQAQAAAPPEKQPPLSHEQQYASSESPTHRASIYLIVLLQQTRIDFLA